MVGATITVEVDGDDQRWQHGEVVSFRLGNVEGYATVESIESWDEKIALGTVSGEWEGLKITTHWRFGLRVSDSETFPKEC